MNCNNHMPDIIPCLQPLIGTTSDEAVIRFLKISAIYLCDTAGQLTKSAQCRAQRSK